MVIINLDSQNYPNDRFSAVTKNQLGVADDRKSHCTSKEIAIDLRKYSFRKSFIWSVYC